jgi:uncharacterized protein YraI
VRKEKGMSGKRRTVRLAVVVAVLAALTALAIAPMSVLAKGATVESASGEWATVVNARLGLRVRSGPSLTDAITYVAYNGDEMSVVGDPVWNQGIRWVEVDYDVLGDVHVTGWVASAYLDNYPGYDEPHDGYTGTEGYKVTAAIGLRLRVGPGLGYRVERIVPYGTVLERTATAGETYNGLHWVELDLAGTELWAASEYLTQVP